MNYWTQSKDNIYVAAHRGWSTIYPENTLLAFKKAIEIGVDQIETDVRITRDGELVCIHDATVGYRTGKGQFSFQSQRKAMPKNAQTTAQLHSSHTPRDQCMVAT